MFTFYYSNIIFLFIFSFSEKRFHVYHISILYNLWPLIFPKNGRQAKYEKLPIKKLMTQNGIFKSIIYQRAGLKKAGVLQNLIVIDIIVLAMKRLTYVKKVSKFFDFLKVFKANSIYFI